MEQSRIRFWEGIIEDKQRHIITLQSWIRYAQLRDRPATQDLADLKRAQAQLIEYRDHLKEMQRVLTGTLTNSGMTRSTKPIRHTLSGTLTSPKSNSRK